MHNVHTTLVLRTLKYTSCTVSQWWEARYISSKKTYHRSTRLIINREGLNSPTNGRKPGTFHQHTIMVANLCIDTTFSHGVGNLLLSYYPHTRAHFLSPHKMETGYEGSNLPTRSTYCLALSPGHIRVCILCEEGERWFSQQSRSPCLASQPPSMKVGAARTSQPQTQGSVLDFFLTALENNPPIFLQSCEPKSRTQSLCLRQRETSFPLGNTPVDDSQEGQTLTHTHTHTLHSTKGLACKTAMVVWLQLPGISVRSM